jgi:uncharacterized membrane protein YdjX (TVP38/TMEM64 family)
VKYKKTAIRQQNILLMQFDQAGFHLPVTAFCSLISITAIPYIPGQIHSLGQIPFRSESVHYPSDKIP